MTSSQFDQQNRDVTKMFEDKRAGKGTTLSAGCVHETISLGQDHAVAKKDPDLIPPEYPEVEFRDEEIQEAPAHVVDWISVIKKICLAIIVPVFFGGLFMYGILSGNVSGEFGWPISWGCSLVAAFSAGAIIVRGIR